MIEETRAQAVTGRVLAWYQRARRDLPWRRPEASPWDILVSEFMLQQTPVARVLEPWRRWVTRWPMPAALAEAPAGEAVRAWGRLGYPRRALRLHQAATVMVARHGGQVPAGLEELMALPGVGQYTAAAVASFAYGRRHVVLDTNVRRVLARVATGTAHPPAGAGAAERALAERFLPSSAPVAARWAAASMELGALVCTARAPRCPECPVRDVCAWRAAGHPAWTGPARRGQPYEGTDRQCRGVLLAVLRSAEEPVAAEALEAAWPATAQRERALASLLADGLVVPAAPARFGLP